MNTTNISFYVFRTIQLDRLKEAELYFAESTLFGVYLPNVWAYLATINIRLGENYKALECWKYARLVNNNNKLQGSEIIIDFYLLNLFFVS